MIKINSSLKKIVSVLLAVLLMAASIPVSMVQGLTTEDDSQQIEYAGGWNPPQYAVNGTLYEDRVAVSKTIIPTEKENYFDINLQVVAKPVVVDQSVDVVVVMDISNTMNATYDGKGVGSSGYNVANARITHAKNATNKFLDVYSADDNISENRRFGLVTFNSYANTIVPLTKVNTEAKATEIKNIVNNITAPKGERVRYTNIEGGLQLAYNLLKQSDATFKYIIFITDGYPTTYIESGRDSLTQIVGYHTYMSGSYNSSKVGTDGYFADSVSKKLVKYGTNYSDKAADKADDVAAKAKSDGINIFSIGIGVGVRSIDYYVNAAKNKTHTTVDRTSANYVIGNSPDSYKYWLRDQIAGGPMIEKTENKEDIHRYATGNSASELDEAFANILSDIKVIPVETIEEAYNVDPMSENVEFLSFYDSEGNPVSYLENSKTGKDVAVFDAETETIKWWLTTAQDWDVDESGNYVMSLTYSIRLKNEAEGFKYNTALETNDKTTLYFKTLDFETGEVIFEENSIDYLIPKVEGYKGDFTFTKQDGSTNQCLEGAEFALKHIGESCNICGGDADIADMNGKSDENGKVYFESIPSGHEYVLVETKAPEGYQQGAHHNLTVAYGNMYFDGALVTPNAPAVVKNQIIEPIGVVFTAQKMLDGRELKGGEFSFVLEGDISHERVANNEAGKVVFREILFDEPGTYSFKVYEEKGTDPTVIYDTKVYNAQVRVTLSEDGNRYEAETFVDNVKVTDPLAPAPFEFANAVRKAGTAQLKAYKTLDGEIPEDGVFFFNLIDENGTVLQTKTTVNGEAVFDELSYENEGVHRYIIREEHPEEGEMTEVFFDHREYTAKITVTAPENGDAFETQVEYSLGGEQTEAPVFENKTRTPATIEFGAIKKLDGLSPAQGQFEFLLTDEEGNTVAKVANAANGLIEFPVVTFDEVGYYTYNVKEVIGNSEGIIYDKTIYNIFVDVDVRHDIQDYYLDVIIEKPQPDGESVFVARAFGSHLDISTNGYITFENTSIVPTQVELVAQKFVDGEIPSENQVFEFVLKDEGGNVIQTVSNTGSQIKFEKLKFSKSGTYNYSITEAEGNEESVIYDAAQYDVKVMVSAPKDGSTAYVAQVEISKAGQSVEKIEFFNTTIEETTVTTVPIETDPTEPESSATVPTVGTDPTEPESSVTVPTAGTDPTEPESSATVPTAGTDPTEPESSVTVPTAGTDPTEPESSATVPTAGTDPTEPESSVTVPTAGTDPTEPESSDTVTSVPTETSESVEDFTIPVESHLTAPTGTGVVPPDENDATGNTGTSPKGTSPDIPDTGEGASLVLCGAIILVVMAGAVLLIAKKKEKTEK